MAGSAPRVVGAATQGGVQEVTRCGEPLCSPLPALRERGASSVRLCRSAPVPYHNNGGPPVHPSAPEQENGIMPLEAVVSEPQVDNNGLAPALTADADPAETQDWLDALDAVIESEGPQRAVYLLNRLQMEAHRHGVRN